MTTVRDYPWDELPRHRRDHLGLLAALRSELGPDARGAFARWSAAQPRTPAIRLHALRLLAGADASLGGAVLALALRGPDGVRATLALDPRLLGAIVSAMIGGEPQAALAPGPIERGLALFAAAGVLAELGEDCAWTVEAEVEPALRAIDALVEAELALGEARGLAWVALEATAAARLVARARPRALARERGARIAGARSLLPVEVGRLSLTLAELGSLGPGDVLVSPDCPRPADSYPCLLRVGAGGLPAVATVGVAGSLRIEEPYRRGGLGMSPSTEKSDNPLAEDLPVELAVELGRLSLSAAQVLDLEPGDVLALERPLRAAVELRVGDRVVARGELCDLEGEAGVRLLEVFNT
jgi:type III secretion system YscQ/HrcQ family protein